MITGGAGYIGQAAAASLAELGCDLWILDRPGCAVHELSDELALKYNVQVRGLECDLEVAEARTAAVDQIKNQSGKLEILINNASFVGDTKLEGWVEQFEGQGLDAVRRCFEVGLTAAFHLSQLCYPLLASESKGRVLNVGSIYGVTGPDMSLYDDLTMGNPAAYAMSKGGLMQLTRWMSTVLAPDVRVNAISPGGVFRNQPELFVHRYEARTPMRRMATEEDFKGAVAYFSTDLSAYVTGQNLMVDGGWTAW